MGLEKGDKTYLVVGVDESNHISELDVNRKEIVAATFSRDANDGNYKAYSNRRDDKRLDLLREWMQQSGRDYRFATITNPEIRKFQPIAAVVTVPLIRGYISYLKSANREVPSNLRLFVDGILSEEHREYMRNAFSEDFETVMVRNLIKRDRISAARRKGRKLVGPRVIEIADILSHELSCGMDYDQTPLSREQLRDHQKRIILDEKSILEAIGEEIAKRGN